MLKKDLSYKQNRFKTMPFLLPIFVSSHLCRKPPALTFKSIPNLKLFPCLCNWHLMTRGESEAIEIGRKKERRNETEQEERER